MSCSDPLGSGHDTDTISVNRAVLHQALFPDPSQLSVTSEESLGTWLTHARM